MSSSDLLDDVTASSEIVNDYEFPETKAPSISQLTDEAGYIFGLTNIIRQVADDTHLTFLTQEWKRETSKLIASDIESLLSELSELGFAWRDIAKMIGVSTPAIQKWRRGGKAAGENRTSLAALLATCNLVAEKYLVQDVASWFESPIILDYPITPIDLYAAKDISLVFQLASNKSDPEQILSKFDPTWRESFRRKFEVVEVDGQLALRPRND